MARLTQAALERAVGGAAALVQLLDKDGDGVADSAIVTEILDEVDAEANSYIQLAIDVSSSQVDTAPLLLMREKACAVYLCWLRGTQAQAMPPEVEKGREDAIRWYQDVGERRATLGTTTRPTTSQPVMQVVKSDGEDYYRTVKSSAGNPGPRGRFGGWA